MSDRDELVAGLRALADFYENNPTMPLPPFPDLSVSCSNITGYGTDRDNEAAAELVQHAAKLLGTEVERSGGHTRTKRMFGSVQLKAYAVSAESMADHNAHMSYVNNVKATGSAS